MTEAPESAGRRSWERLLSPLSGLVLAVAVLVMSFVLDHQHGLSFAKGVLAVIIAAVVAIVVFLIVTSRHAVRLLSAAMSQSADATHHGLRTTASRLTDTVDRLEFVLQREVSEIASAPDLTDQQLAKVERAGTTIEVVICRREMGPEFDPQREPTSQIFFRTVEANLARDVRYRWLTEDNSLSRQREKLVRELFPDHTDQVQVTRLPLAQWRTLPFSFETVFIFQRTSSGGRVMLGFADVSFSVESGRVWRQIGQGYSLEWWDEVEQLVAVA